MVFARSHPLRRLLLLLLAVCVLPVVLALAARGLGSRADQESLDLTAQAIRRAAVQCYALEGAYPANLSYLEERYGIQVDESRVFVDYQYVAANLMPDITVLPRTADSEIPG